LVTNDLRDRDLDVLIAKERVERVTARLREVEHAHGLFEERVVANAHKLIVHERRGRVEAVDELHEVRARLLDVEDDLSRHQRLLWKLETTRRRELLQMSNAVRDGDAEVARLLGEREVFRARSEMLAATLEEVKALSEATA